ncbi:proline and serine-rich protein 2-like [Sinocyclocheilus grahami]|uniref:proline and serine-rich protein 2-like n=1 Tax=Sinocyclocheilus grahami TaxID=75366 RepID=UPI0007AC8B76|nr:PREDICTED: proline and serine-rich protein 2-like [Sinocyclocheilus grahami]
MSICPDDARQFLSLEERECILFFEETIGSLEEDDERTGISAGGHRLAVERPLSYTTARHPSPVDHDIIDLVHPTPDPSKQKDTLPIMPDFQQLIIPPETHFEVKPKRDLDVSDGPQFGHQPPAGSVPTQVVIASKIAEHQGAGGTSASQLLQRRRSLESPPNPSTKHDPPTHAKPTRLPDSISMLLGSREHIPHSIAAEAIRSAGRKCSRASPAQHTLWMVANRPACATFPYGAFRFEIQRQTSLGWRANADTTDPCQTKSGPAPTLTSAEVTHSDFNSYGGKSIMLNPTSSFRAEYRSSSVPKTESSDVHLNNFGGRSRVVTPSHPNHGTQTKTITPVKEDNSSSNRTSNEGLSKRKASHSEAPVKQPPAPAPKPRSAPLSPELRRKSLPKPSFRTQGITVQFSGRGATDEARRDALRKLGLLRSTL